MKLTIPKPKERVCPKCVSTIKVSFDLDCPYCRSIENGICPDSDTIQDEQ